MSYGEIELTACCGLYCSDCIRYRSRAADLARELISELEDKGFDKYAALKSGSAKQFDTVKQFEHYGEFCKVMAAIVDLQCNEPCRIGGGCPAFSCTILNCCRKKGFEGCWQCGEFESCSNFEPLKSIHGYTPQQNLKTIKEFGLDRWAEYRRKCYVWQ